VLRAVVDVNVLVSAAIGRESPPTKVVRACLAGAFELVVSAALLAELDRVLATPRIAGRLERDDVERLRAALERAAIHVDDPPAERVVPDDPDDDYLVALARAGRAQVIVTGDRHLLDLETLRPPALDPRRFLELLERAG
jgi:putative PIN family toxin of toxin-antitoxin system